MSQRVPPAQLTRHDVLLVAIGLPLVVAAAVGLASAVPLDLLLVGACVPACGGLGYALFVRPPGMPRD